jgi:hypothetical protein
VTTVFDPAVRPSSLIVATYNTRGADDQIPLRVFDIREGSFKVEGQTGQTFTYFVWTP